MTSLRERLNASWGWLLGLYTAASLIETIFYSQLLAFTPLYLPRLGVAETDIPYFVGMITALANAIGIPFLPFWGALADRYSRKPIIIRSFVVMMVAGALGFLASNVWVFVAARAITSFALGNSGLMMTTLTERLPRNRLGLGFSIMNSAAPIGAFLGPLIGGPIVDRFGFPTLLVVNTVLLLGVVLGLALGYRDEFVGRNTGPLLRMAMQSFQILWNSRRLRWLFPALFFVFGGWMLSFTYVPIAVTQLYTGPEPGKAIGLVLGASGVTTLLLSPLLGALADRFGQWRLLFIGGVVTLILWPIPAFLPDIWSFGVVWALLNGVVSAIFALSFSVLASSTTDDVRGRVMSFAYLPANVGFTMGAALGTLITRSSVFNVFPASAAMTAFGLLLLYIAYRQPVLAAAG
ncbi:MAG: MFS transporter [Anaerolineae bacterium]|nr:MAG: MFS transporter [Anaerolineae bacterium]